MNNNVLKRCKVCGKEYEACVSCEKKHSWKVHTDSAEHYYIFITLMQYMTDHDAKGAYKALRKRGVDLREVDGYVPSVQKLLTEINTLAHENVRPKKGETVVELAVSEEGQAEQTAKGEK